MYTVDFNLLRTSGDPSQQHPGSNTWIAAIAKLVALSCVVLCALRKQMALRFKEEYRAEVGSSCGSEAFASRLVDQTYLIHH